MPSGPVTLLIPFDDPIMVAHRGAAPRAFGSGGRGPSTAPAHVHHDGNQLALRPGAACLLVGCPAGGFLTPLFTISQKT
jgi:hypothetical protein